MFAFSERHVTVCHYNDKRSRAFISIMTHGRSWRVDHSIMINVTWRHFDQSAKQLIVGHTTKYFANKTSLCSATYVSWQRDTARILLPCEARCWAPGDRRCRSIPQARGTHSSKPAARRPNDGRTDRQAETDGRTLDSFIDSSPFHWKIFQFRSGDILLKLHFRYVFGFRPHRIRGCSLLLLIRFDSCTAAMQPYAKLLRPLFILWHEQFVVVDELIACILGERRRYDCRECKSCWTTSWLVAMYVT